MISHVRIQNLRSLVDTGFIEIKPLTILLGSNSSGKSSFLRSFPLLKQSVNKPLREPISWFDDTYVDFGDYDTAKSRLVPEDEGIRFSYKVTAPLYGQGKSYGWLFGYRQSDFQTEMPSDSIIGISIKKSKKGITYVDKVIIETDEFKVCFYVDDIDSDLFIECEGLGLSMKGIKWRYNGNNAIIPSVNNEDLYYSLESLNRELTDKMIYYLKKSAVMDIMEILF